MDKVKVSYNSTTRNYSTHNKEISAHERRKKQLERRINNLYCVLFTAVIIVFIIICFLFSEPEAGYYTENLDKDAEIHYVWVEE